MWKIMKENLEDLLNPNLWRSLASETVGTLVIVLFGCGAWVQGGLAGGLGGGGAAAAAAAALGSNVVQISLAFGLSVATMVWCFAHISGGHFNPALTAATLVTRRVSIVRGLFYILAQVLGGILGAAILYGLTPETKRGSLGATYVVDTNGVTQAQAFGVEMLITFVFVLAFFASRDSDRSDMSGSYPLTVGLAAVVCHIFAINYTRAGMNCARSFGPALIMDMWDDHWVYWVGPLTGGVLAGILYDYVFSAGATVAKARKCLLRTKRPAPASKSAAQEKPPLEGGAAPEVIEIDEKEPEKEEEKEAADPNATPTDSDKAKLTEECAKE